MTINDWYKQIKTSAANIAQTQFKINEVHLHWKLKHGDFHSANSCHTENKTESSFTNFISMVFFLRIQSKKLQGVEEPWIILIYYV